MLVKTTKPVAGDVSVVPLGRTTPEKYANADKTRTQREAGAVGSASVASSC